MTKAPNNNNNNFGSSKLPIAVFGVIVILWTLIANIMALINTQRIDDLAARVSINTPIVIGSAGSIKRLEGIQESHTQIHQATDRELTILREEITTLRRQLRTLADPGFGKRLEGVKEGTKGGER